MKKKPKFLLRIDRSNRCHIYMNGKWQKGVAEINLHGIPCQFDIEMRRFKMNGDRCIVENNDLIIETKKYFIGIRKSERI